MHIQFNDRESFYDQGRKWISNSDLTQRVDSCCMRVQLGLQRFCKPSASFFHTSPYSRSHRITEKLPEKMANIDKTAHPFDKARLEALLNRRFFYAPAFEIYGGMQSCILVARIIQRYDKPLYSRCRWSLRLWPTWFVSSGQYHSRMAKALHHPREHA